MTTYYVSTNGSDGDSGSASSPWRTISRAMKADLESGDEVVVRSGTYKESVTISQDGLTLRSEVRGGAKIDVPSDGSMGINVNANYVKVDGFEVFGSDRSGIGGSRVHHVEVTNNESHDNETAGIYFRQSEFITIEDNVVYENARSGPSSGISVHNAQNITGDTSTKGFRFIIRDNVSYDNVAKNGPRTDANGIIIDDFRTTKNPDLNEYRFATLVENNVVYNNGGKGIQVVWSDYVTVRNNTAWHNSTDQKSDSTWRAELSNTQSSYNTWINNIAVANPKLDKHNVAISSISTGDYKNKEVVWHNNLTFNGNSGDDSVRANGSNSFPTSANGNKLGVNPDFVNAPFNFKLESGSPAIDGGTHRFGTGQAPLDGKGTIDIGAFQFGGRSSGSGSSSSGGDSASMEDLHGDDGAEQLHGNHGANRLNGGDGDDKLHGYRGRDFLSGGEGEDLLRGGKGKDNLVGGADADVFAFRYMSHAGQGFSRDVIRDFSGAAGDKIDLSGIDANADVSGNQRFSFIGKDEFSGKGGQLRYEGGVLTGDVDGDKRADFQIELANDHRLDAGDFLL
jgi:parallel beta-helix repeat protein